jgi:hypothetical protein
MYERSSAPLLTHRRFLWRLLRHGGVVVALVIVSLALGMAGYREFARMAWVDAFLNSCMLLGGMGPVGDLPTDGAKIFAGLYALYAGLVFIVSVGILLAPIAHRIFHRLHAE